jgi:hypothetical protein
MPQSMLSQRKYELRKLQMPPKMSMFLNSDMNTCMSQTTQSHLAQASSHCTEFVKLAVRAKELANRMGFMGVLEVVPY